MPSDKKIIFEFMQDGESLRLDDSLFSVTDYSGIESSDYELVTAENVNGEGARKKRRKVLSRQIMVGFDYLFWSDRAEMRERLIRFFSPYSSGTLKVSYMGVERNVDYELESFQISGKNVHEVLSCLVYVNCLDPSLKSITVYGESIMTLIGGWKWKFSLPFQMRRYGELKKNIYNRGHLETPVEIYFKGPAVAPKIINHRTGQYIQVTKTLTSDDTLYVSTMYRELTVKIIGDGGTTDAWNWLNPESEFFRLQPGDNMIEYDSGSVKSKGVEVHYRERYLGV